MTSEERAMMLFKAARGQFLNNAMAQFNAQYGGSSMRNNSSDNDSEESLESKVQSEVLRALAENTAFVNLNDERFYTKAPCIILNESQVERTNALLRIQEERAEEWDEAMKFIENTVGFTEPMPCVLAPVKGD